MLQAITTKYLGPTNHRGGRVKAYAQAGTITVDWDHGLNADDNHTTAARALALKMGWAGRYHGGALPNGRGYCYVLTHNPDNRGGDPCVPVMSVHSKEV